MTKIRKNRIRRGGARGISTQEMSEAVDDLSEHFAIGVVRAEKGDSHFTIEDGNVWVDCVTMPHEAPVTCRLGCVAGSPGRGVWSVPAEGTEVAIAFPGGSRENGGIITCILSTANLPEGVAEDQIVIVAPKVLVYNTDSADAEPLPTLAEFKLHTHPTGTGPSAPTTDPIPGVGPITGTLVLETE